MPTTDGRFTKYTAEEFGSWISGISVSRTISRVQQHHTYIPKYANFSGSNHFAIQKGMRDHHVINNGWSDIGQHFSIFPDGTILTGRGLNKNPACIYGANSEAICIENVGFFDKGKDSMRSEQKNAIIDVTAAILGRFSAIPRNDKGIIYHHWFDLKTGARRDGAGSTKSCPGTNFFGGNKVDDFNSNFLPLIIAALGGSAAPVPSIPRVSRFVVVTSDFLNIRTGPNAGNSKITEHGPAELGSILRVYDEKNGWLKISNTKQYWIFGRYTQTVSHGEVNTDDSNVREGPGMNFEVIEVLSAGESVFVHSNDGNWLNIGPERWLHNSLVT